MPVPTNILQTVQTYNDSGLAYLQNSFALVGTSNKKFDGFERIKAQLGDTVAFDKPPRYIAANGLVATFQPSEQRIQTLTVDNQQNVSYAFTAEQFIFNVRDYMNKFGKSAIRTLGGEVEKSMGQKLIDHTYRFYGDGSTAIDSYTKLATALAYFRNYGAAPYDTRGYIPDIAEPAIVGTGLSQFVIDRNEDIATSWKIGKFSECMWHRSNLLPVHTAGTVGNTPQTLTVVSTNDPTGANITQITFSGATADDTNAIKKGDLLFFDDGVSGQPDLRYLTFNNYALSDNKVQFRAEADAGASGAGNVIINIFPALVSVTNNKQNIQHNIVAGMQASAVPSHRVGALISGDALYLAMPRLPDQDPFKTANQTDPDSGTSCRMTYGSMLGLNQTGIIHDAIWGSTLVDEYSMRLIFPL